MSDDLELEDEDGDEPQGDWITYIEFSTETVINSHLRALLQEIEALSSAERDVVVAWVSHLSWSEATEERLAGRWRVQARVRQGLCDDLERMANEHNVSRTMLLRMGLYGVLADPGQIPQYDRHGDCATCTVVLRVSDYDRHRIATRATRDQCKVSDVIRAAIVRAITESYLS